MTSCHSVVYHRRSLSYPLVTSIVSLPGLITILRHDRPCQPAKSHSSSQPGEQTALPSSHVPVSQAARIHQASRCLVSFVMSLAKLHTLLPTSIRRKVDTKGSWRRTFKASHGEIQLPSATRLAPCSSQVAAKFPAPIRLCLCHFQSQVSFTDQPAASGACSCSRPRVSSDVGGN